MFHSFSKLFGAGFGRFGPFVALPPGGPPSTPALRLVFSFFVEFHNVSLSFIGCRGKFNHMCVFGDSCGFVSGWFLRVGAVCSPPELT